MKQTLKKYLPEIIGTILGGTGGYLYWKYVGCVTGTCTLKSNWYLMVPWGMLLGYLLGSLVKDTLVRMKNRKTGIE